MTGATKAAIVLGAAALASLGLAVGLAVAASPASSPGGAPQPPPTPGTTPAPTPGPVLPPASAAPWTPATQIAPGQRVRLSVSAADLAQLAQSVGTSADFGGWSNILANAAVQSVVRASTLSAWGPGIGGVMVPAPLPADWPADDTAAATEFHAEFVYGGPQAILVSAFPVPTRAWVQQGG